MNKAIRDLVISDKNKILWLQAEKSILVGPAAGVFPTILEQSRFLRLLAEFTIWKITENCNSQRTSLPFWILLIQFLWYPMMTLKLSEIALIVIVYFRQR